MSEKPAETIERLSDYLWWLLPSFLKKKDRQDSLAARLCDVWGGILDTARSPLVDIIPQLVVETAAGDYLAKLARARQIFRGEGETDDSLRIRVLAAHEIKRKGGTIPGMEDGLAAIGYTAAVDEPNKGTDKWSRFVVRILGWDGAVADQKVFYSDVRLLKPAHTWALIESLIYPEVWDSCVATHESHYVQQGIMLS
jgi:hypothetical protein